METKQVPGIRVEYELPPLRAIYVKYFHDDGQSDDEILGAFQIEVGKEYRVRSVTRAMMEVEANQPGGDDGK